MTLAVSTCFLVRRRRFAITPVGIALDVKAIDEAVGDDGASDTSMSLPWNLSPAALISWLMPLIGPATMAPRLLLEPLPSMFQN